MSFEYDPEKSAANKTKHGIDFEEAQALWEDDNRVELRVVSNTEERFVVTGKIMEKYWTVVITYRQLAIRIISARRARRKEVEIYEKTNANSH